MAIKPRITISAFLPIKTAKAGSDLVQLGQTLPKNLSEAGFYPLLDSELDGTDLVPFRPAIPRLRALCVSDIKGKFRL